MIKEKDIYARNQIKKASEQISQLMTPIIEPTGFAWTDSPVHGKIFKLSDGSYRTNLDVSDYGANSGVEYFVNQTSGNDSNDGLTSATALKKMITAYNKSDVGKINLTGDVFHYTNAMTTTEFDKAINVSAFGGGRCVISNHDYGAWSKTAGKTYVYQRTVTGAATVINRIGTTNKDILKLILAASVDVCDATANSYYISGTTVYVHSPTGASPSTSILVLRSDVYALSIYLTTGKIAYFKNVDFLGGVYLHGNGMAVFDNCTFQHGQCPTDEENSVTVDGSNIKAIFHNCIGVYAKKDGFNYKNGAKVIEINCVGRNNGDGTLNTQNGSTSHGGSNIIRINGVYYSNHGPNVVDVQDNTQSWNLGCTAYSSTAIGEGTNRECDFATSTEGATKMWLDGCVGYGSVSNMSCATGTIMYVRNCSFDRITADGTVTKY